MKCQECIKKEEKYINSLCQECEIYKTNIECIILFMIFIGFILSIHVILKYFN